MRRELRAAAALLLVAGGVVLGLLASDVRRWETRLEQDDLAFRETPDRHGLYDMNERLPGGARLLLEIDDDLAFRRALQLFATSISVVRDDTDPEPPATRRAAEISLAHVARSDSDPVRRSEATNLLGVLSVSPTGQAPGEVRGDRLESAIANFRSATVLDERNERAKHNLELALRSRPPEEDVNLPRAVGGQGALGRAGSGY